MSHKRRPRIQKMKCLAQKLTKWRRIEKLWQKRENEIFSKIDFSMEIYLRQKAIDQKNISLSPTQDPKDEVSSSKIDEMAKD